MRGQFLQVVAGAERRPVGDNDQRADTLVLADLIQRRMQRTVWVTGGCASWYIDAKGRNSTLWPTFTFAFRRRTARFEPSAYTLAAAAPRRAAA